MPAGACELFTENQVLDAINLHKGKVSGISDMLDCAISTVWEYVKRYPRLRARLEYWRMEMIDLAEIETRKAAGRGEPWACQTILKGPGKSRGWSERIEHTGADGGAIEMEVTSSPLSEYADVIGRISQASEIKEIEHKPDIQDAEIVSDPRTVTPKDSWYNEIGENKPKKRGRPKKKTEDRP